MIHHRLLVTVNGPSQHIINKLNEWGGEMAKLTPLEKMYLLQGAMAYQFKQIQLEVMQDYIYEAYSKLDKLIHKRLYGKTEQADYVYLNMLYEDIFEGDTEYAHQCFIKYHS